MGKGSAQYKGINALVVGLGVSGRAAADLLLAAGARVTGVDGNSAQLRSHGDVCALSDRGLVIDDAATLEGVDLVVISPGVPPTHPLCRGATGAAIPIIGEAELACRCATQLMVAITGTNGKSTTTLLTTHLLNNAGVPAVALGNVGEPLSSLTADRYQDHVIVVELSSFQLETLTTPCFQAAALLNISPDHLDRYPTMGSYVGAKLRIAKLLNPGGVLYVGENVGGHYLESLGGVEVRTFGFGSGCYLRSDGDHVVVDESVEQLLPLGYRGIQSHDVENLLAAYGLCRALGVAADDCLSGVATFTKPPHRLQFVKKRSGVAYFDDSKGTNIDAVVHAVTAVPGPVILIAGGVHKGSSYDCWKAVFPGRVKQVFVIGEAREAITEDIGDVVPVHKCEDLEQAVALSAESAEAGDNVVLSPGCSSFDMFQSYVHRGEAFQRLVNQL